MTYVTRLLTACRSNNSEIREKMVRRKPHALLKGINRILTYFLHSAPNLEKIRYRRCPQQRMERICVLSKWYSNSHTLTVTIYFEAQIYVSQIKHQLDATLCRFCFCRVTLHVLGVRRPSSGVLKNWHGGPWYRCSVKYITY